MRNAVITSICFLLFTGAAGAQQSSAPAKKSAPRAEKTLGVQKDTTDQPAPKQDDKGAKAVFENEKVKVTRYELPAGATLETAEHQTDRILVPTSDLTLVSAGRRVKARTGEVQIAKASTGEKLINSGTEPMVVVVVDLAKRFDPGTVICGLGEARCESQLGGDLTHGSWGINTLLKGLTLEISNMEIDPGVTTDELKRKAPALRVAISQSKVAEQVGDAQPSIVEQMPGDVTWVQAGDPVTIKNMGVTKASFATIAFPTETTN